MSGDFYDALGLVRTQELLVADRYMGVGQYFSRAVDYGFSKTREEAHRKMVARPRVCPTRFGWSA